jgi:site-specific DNA recombinase
MRKRVIGYARVSTEKQDLIRQKELINEYCNQNDYILKDITEEKISGAKTENDRVGLYKLLNLNHDVADLIVVSEISRLSREDEIMEVLSKINGFLKKGFDVVFLDKQEKVYKANSSLGIIEIITLSIEAKAAADERIKIADRMKTGKHVKIKSNPSMYTGGTAPYGFKVVENPEYNQQIHTNPKSLMILDEQESNNVKLIFSWILQGMTLSEACNKANNLGWITKLNKPFCQTSIAKIIKNPIYKGERRFKGFDLAGESIISKEDWALAQDRLKSNKLYKGKGKEHFNPLKGIFFCPCGYSMMLHLMSRKGGTAYLTYHCCVRHRKEYGHKCKNSGIKADILEYIVWHCIKKRVVDKEYIERNNQEFQRIERSVDLLRSKIQTTNKEIHKIHTDMEKIPDVIMSLTLTDSPNKSLLKRMNDQYSKFETLILEKNKHIESLNSEIGEYQKQQENIKSVIAQKEMDSYNEHDKAAIYKRLLSKVVYYSETITTGFIVISFKNGLECVVAKTSRNKSDIYALPPSAFSFNKDKRMVVFTSISNSSCTDSNQLNFDMTNNKKEDYYHVSDIKDLFDEETLDKWRLYE